MQTKSQMKGQVHWLRVYVEAFTPRWYKPSVESELIKFCWHFICQPGSGKVAATVREIWNAGITASHFANLLSQYL